MKLRAAPVCSESKYPDIVVRGVDLTRARVEEDRAAVGDNLLPVDRNWLVVRLETLADEGVFFAQPLGDDLLTTGRADVERPVPHAVDGPEVGNVGLVIRFPRGDVSVEPLLYAFAGGLANRVARFCVPLGHSEKLEFLHPASLGEGRLDDSRTGKAEAADSDQYNRDQCHLGDKAQRVEQHLGNRFRHPQFKQAENS